MSFRSAEETYEEFFLWFNSENAEGWANVMQYPHVRISSGVNSSYLSTSGLSYFETKNDYANAVSWESFKASGWVRTHRIDPVRIHESEHKVHLAGGWTRYDENDEPIVSNRVTYILTQIIKGTWKIQARFGVDSFNELEDHSYSSNSAIDIVQQHLDAWNTADFSRCIDLANYPLIDVGTGRISQFDTPEDYAEVLARREWFVTSDYKINAFQIGSNGVNISVDANLANGDNEQIIFLVALVDSDWRIIGRSRIRE